ncbi:MAG: hypothetical protein HFH59_08775 [Lachnospiraceae bacterium]|nr:hypothetical protein [Lachnospiraceae bacterium]MCI9099971.1 hypothetical protein [Lachnospiraceae bacterium]MCI9357618.1 hypothetical protein [Lachnospiraceae bacterium]
MCAALNCDVGDIIEFCFRKHQK